MRKKKEQIPALHQLTYATINLLDPGCSQRSAMFLGQGTILKEISLNGPYSLFVLGPPNHYLVVILTKLYNKIIIKMKVNKLIIEIKILIETKIAHFNA